MKNAAQTENFPPKLRKTAEGEVDINSLADLLEWFLNNDERVRIVRHPHVDELFQWKQADDETQGVPIYPFENAEARFAVGTFQALGENDSEPKLGRWITDVLQALGESKQMREDLGAQYKLDAAKSHVEEAAKITSPDERRLFLTSSWIESLCTAEVRFLGWVYQELYGKQFQPMVGE